MKLKFAHKDIWEWHKWFCWRPVKLINEEETEATVFWLCCVERQRAFNGTSSATPYFKWVYRESLD